MCADTLAPDSLEWALRHIQKYGDRDLFPPAFEFQAIRHCWEQVRDLLTSCDVGEYRPQAPQRVLVPKTGYGFRPAIQLDPRDTLVYTGLVYESAEAVERCRVPRAARVACSYRVGLDEKGTFFRESEAWRDYHTRSRELALSGDYTHVVVADIADFYNQAYHHRVENALEAAAVSQQRAKNIESFLLHLSAKQSRGLPVGPSASALLAEACMDDVDKFLLGPTKAHVRYVDDFRIFCRSMRDAVTALHDLTEYLHTAHRLSLQLSKTDILSMDEFVARHLQDPEEEEERGKKERLEGWIDEIWHNTGYAVGIDDLPEHDVAQAVRENLEELFEAALTGRFLRSGFARYLLRRATALRTRQLYKRVFSSLEQLAPAFRDVAIYLRKTMPGNRAAEWGPLIREFLMEGDMGHLPFVRMWGLWLLQEFPTMLPFDDALALVKASEDKLGLRPAALLARAHKRLDWVRAQKENWQNRNPWDRRAIIWAGSVLPPGERGVWLDHVREAGDPLDGVVAQAARVA